MSTAHTTVVLCMKPHEKIMNFILSSKMMRVAWSIEYELANLKNSRLIAIFMMIVARCAVDIECGMYV